MDGVLDAAQNIEAAAGRMHSTTSSALWNIASFIPVLGSDVKSVQTISATLDTLANDALTPVAEALKGQGLNTLFTENGSININLLTNVCTVLSNSKPSINKAAKEMSALPDAHIAQLQTALEKAKPLVATLNDTVNAASAVAPYLPQMLGANGQTRTYVVVAQNNSELRATGGFPGSTGLLTVTNGKIELGEFSGISKLNGGEGTLPTTEVEQTMYPNGYTKIPQLITTNPDWSSTGMHVRDLWADRVGDVANGAIAVDPVFLQHLLALTGGVTLSDGSTIDGTNAATILLHNVYLEKAVPDQDPYFAEAAGAAAKQVMSNLGKVDLTALIETVAKDAKAGRVMVWMENADEENAIAKLGLEGAVSQDSTVPELGVYIDDNTWAKMSWYLSSHIEVGQGTANADGSKTYDVTVRVKNNCTTEEAQTLTHYISGYNPELKALGNMIYGVTLYAPANGTISNIQSSAGTTYAETKYGNCQVWQYGGQVQLAPQEEETLTFTVTTSTDAQTELAVRTTPTAQEVAGWQ